LRHPRSAVAAQHTQHFQRIDAEQQTRDHHHNDGAATQFDPASAESGTARRAAVLDVSL
jgi:hypothetical protein